MMKEQRGGLEDAYCSFPKAYLSNWLKSLLTLIAKPLTDLILQTPKGWKLLGVTILPCPGYKYENWLEKWTVIYHCVPTHLMIELHCEFYYIEPGDELVLLSFFSGNVYRYKCIYDWMKLYQRLCSALALVRFEYFDMLSLARIIFLMGDLGFCWCDSSKPIFLRPK